MKKLIALSVLLTGMTLSVQAQFSKPRRAYVEYLVTANHDSRIYKTGEPSALTITAYKGGLPLNGEKVYYTVGDEMQPGRKDSTTFKDGKAVIPTGTRQQPGFRACSLQFSVYGQTYKDLVKLGFSPDSIRSYTPIPKDFDKFWKKTLKEAEKVRLNAEVTPLPKYSTPEVEVSLVKLNVGPDGRNMYGYLTKPRDGKKHPVLFSPPGAGSSKISPTTYYSERGFIYLNINIHSGCNSELSDSAYAEARKIANNYNRNGIGDKDKFYYRSVYAGCSRCVDYLCSLPEWDGSHVGVTGGSQGGALTIVTAALNPKVTFCAPFYPALSDLLGFRHQRAGGWPRYFDNKTEADGAETTLPYYDVVNFARRLECPVFYSFGYNDDTCSPTSTFAVYNEIKSRKVLDVTPTSGHWRFPDTNDHSVEWMQHEAGIK